MPQILIENLYIVLAFNGMILRIRNKLVSKTIQSWNQRGRKEATLKGHIATICMTS